MAKLYDKTVEHKIGRERYKTQVVISKRDNGDLMLEIEQWSLQVFQHRWGESYITNENYRMPLLDESVVEDEHEEVWEAHPEAAEILVAELEKKYGYPKAGGRSQVEQFN